MCWPRADPMQVPTSKQGQQGRFLTTFHDKGAAITEKTKDNIVLYHDFSLKNRPSSIKQRFQQKMRVKASTSLVKHVLLYLN